MTPEEHIRMAEALLEMASQWRPAPVDPDTAADLAKVADAHVRIATYRQQFPPDGGRPIVQRFPMGQVGVEGTEPYPSLPPDHPLNQGKTLESGNLHNHIERIPCRLACPAYGTDSTNYARPIRNIPQA